MNLRYYKKVFLNIKWDYLCKVKCRGVKSLVNCPGLHQDAGQTELQERQDCRHPESPAVGRHQQWQTARLWRMEAGS